ncbi:hypothetical protein KL86SPO_50080 [uncultured Sporomusa sp.]|uniref:HTH cro/C1-type domain-containing protein n=1 Tax=uncultured Sporomusa sp. TaxID=307249 RepID=A0A212LY43_9FIRM|nr:hypothetical protein KL86SPO_50080 [uncultured Sporomusa sp.]
MIGSRIKQARLACNLSQLSLAKKVDISRYRLNKYEKNEIVPDSEMLMKIAKATDKRVEYFFRKIEVDLKIVHVGCIP